jgi:uncharacterized protein (TIGR02266 family)
MNLVFQSILTMPDMSPGTARQYKRVPIELEVTLSSDSNFFAGFSENLSEGGLFVATHVTKPVGSTVELVLTLPDGGPPIAVTGEVRWVREYSETSDTGPGLGVRFIMLSSGSVERIRAFLATRAPLFYDD